MENIIQIGNEFFYIIGPHSFLYKDRKENQFYPTYKVYSIQNKYVDLVYQKNKRDNQFYKVNWDDISCRYQTLSEFFIREFQDKVDWYYISCHQTLSEPFIREFQNKAYWYYISRYQTLSESFKKEFAYRLNNC